MNTTLIHNQLTLEEQLMIEQLKAGETIVLNMSKHKTLMNWAKENGLFVRVDRQSIWGNPFVMKGEHSRDLVCEQYENYLNTKPDLLSKLTILRGKALGCWCAPKRCHADHLKQLSELKESTI